MVRILYISDLDASWPIFHSQIKPYIKELRRYFEVTLVTLNRYTSNEADNTDAISYRSIKGDYFYYIAKLNFHWQKNQIRTVIESKKFDLIYSRGVRGGVIGCFIKRHFYANRILLVNDVRGDALDEHKDSLLDRSVLHHLNKKIYASSDLLFVVSNFLRAKICRQYNFNTDNAFIFPTFVPDKKFNFNHDNRTAIRGELEFSDADVVILYSGNLAEWQNVKTILSAINLTDNYHLKLLILTKEREIYQLVEKFVGDWQKKIRIRTVAYQNIEQYYHAADFGILIRDNTDTNRSSAPTKFSEYVNAGLALIINYIDADYVHLFNARRLKGVLLQEKEDLLACFNRISQRDKERNDQMINTLGELVSQQSRVLTDHFMKYDSRN